jgi:hypothetical protein
MALDYFDDEQILELVNKLDSLTASGKVSWATVGDSEYTFAAQVGATAFAIRSKDDDDLAPHLLAIYVDDESMRLLQEIDSTYMEAPIARLLEVLYQRVKRAALRVDVVAANILRDLDRLSEAE